MSTAAKTRIYRNWRSGVSAAGDPDVGEYNASDAQVYESGNLGPRPGWKELALTNVSAVYDDAADNLQSIRWVRDTDGGEHILVMVFDDSAGEHHLNVIEVATGNVTTVGQLADISGASPFKPPQFNNAQTPSSFDGFNLYSIGAYLGEVNASGVDAPTVPSFPDGPARGMTIYRERAYYWGFGSQPGRIYYSDAADYSTVQALSFFDVSADSDSSAGAVTGVWSVKNALLIHRKDDRWLVLTGTSPENGSLRELGRDIVPDHDSPTVVDNMLYFLNRRAQGVVMATPSFVEARQLAYLSPTAGPGSSLFRPDVDFFPHQGVGDEITRDLFLPGKKSTSLPLWGVYAVERVNDTWALSYQAFDEYAGSVNPRFSPGVEGQMWVVMEDNSSFGLRAFSRDFTLNRPAKSTDSRSVALGDDDSANNSPECIVTLAPIIASDSQVIRPSKVVLEVDYWKGDGFGNPTITVMAEVQGLWGAEAVDALPSQVVDTTSWPDSPGLDRPAKRRVSVPLPNGQFGTRGIVTLVIDNVALESVQVYYEEQDDVR